MVVRTAGNKIKAFVDKCFGKSFCIFYNLFLISFEFVGKSFFEANLDLINKESLAGLFKQYPIYTKVRDDAPVRYAIGSSVKNTVAGDGCFIEGSVEGSVLFRGVKVGKGATVKNCVLMQDAIVEDGAVVENVICDKAVRITAGQKLIGTATHPVYVEKRAKV